MTVIGINVVGMFDIPVLQWKRVNSGTGNSLDDVYPDEGSLLRAKIGPWRSCFAWSLLVRHERVLVDEGSRGRAQSGVRRPW